MLGLMQDWPLLCHRIIDHAAIQHAERPVVTRSVEGPIHTTNYREIRKRALKLAKRLDKDGIRLGDRVATLAWNTWRHLECWYGILGIGAVYHTVNPRLFPDQLAFIANHANDRVMLYDRMFAPIVEIFYPLPKSALIPVTVIWLGFGNGSKILLIFLGCMLPVTIGAYNGARGADRQLVWSARSMGASRLRMLWDVVVPSAMPELLNGIRTALALSFILLVSSELIVARQGFGYLIGFLGANGSYEGMFAVVLTVAFLGFAADRLYQLLMNRVLAWRE